MKNKAKLSTVALAIMAMTITGCDKDEPKEEAKIDNFESISLNKFYASLFYNDEADNSFNEEVQLKATVLPKRGGEVKAKWSSSNTSVATVDANGKVKAVGEGTCEITASNKDGSVSASTHIVVNNMNGISISDCNSRLDDIMSTQNKKDFVVPDIITTYESFEQTVEKNGKAISKSCFVQSILTSEENAYLKLTDHEYNWRCEDGSPVEDDLEYLFYTTDEYISYCFKTTGKNRNYMSVNQSDFIGKGKFNALKAICKNFFRSGDSILTSNYEDILCQSVSRGWLVSPQDNTHYGRLGSVPGQLAFDVHDTMTYVATSDDEDDLNIPAGTSYTLSLEDRILFENYYCTGKRIDESYEYKIGDDEYKITYAVDFYYQAGGELEYPNRDNYSEVESLFDL